ncbi:DnaJ protein like [Dendrobium catenatum]|uniref:DnaJ protein like n=1 Tax=Dendrobium catenatum TaxID=906689 RepID=A0A2I0VPN2_9ASPA|nr:DnaJ protein like [Dendrobium catenatum]
MDCRRRSAVDDDRSRKTRLAVDYDRRQGRWAVDDARSRIAFYQAQSKESLDQVDRNLDRIRKNLRAIRKMRMSSATIPRHSSSSISSSASRRRHPSRHTSTAVDDYAPLELPLTWRDPPPEYPPLELPLRWRDPPPVRAVRNQPEGVFSEPPPLKHAKSRSDLLARPIPCVGAYSDFTFDSFRPLVHVQHSVDSHGRIKDNLAISTEKNVHDDRDMEVEEAAATVVNDSASAQLTGPLLSPFNPSATHPQLPPARTEPHLSSRDFAPPTLLSPSDPTASDDANMEDGIATHPPLPPAQTKPHLSSRDFAPPTLLSLSDPTASDDANMEDGFAPLPATGTPAGELPNSVDILQSEPQPAILQRDSDADHEDLPRLSLDSDKITFPGETDEAPDCVTCDIVFVLQQKDHSKFKIKGDDHVVEHTLSLTEALCGFPFVLTHLDGRQLLIKSNPGDVVKSDQFTAINDEGMPMYQKSFMQGKLYIHFSVDLPDSLTSKQCKALEGIFPLRTPLQLTAMELDEYKETTLYNVDIENIFTAGVQRSGKNFTVKVYLVECSQTVRRNVTEGSNTKFVELEIPMASRVFCASSVRPSISCGDSLGIKRAYLDRPGRSPDRPRTIRPNWIILDGSQNYFPASQLIVPGRSQIVLDDPGADSDITHSRASSSGPVEVWASVGGLVEHRGLSGGPEEVRASCGGPAEQRRQTIFRQR